jgi:exopolysaccharide production protein ExoZ
MKLTNIQILRAVAALGVIFYHVTIESAAVCVAKGTTCDHHFWFGTYGVCLFFMISGFIMVVTSWNSFGQPGAALAFLDKRMKRIVPLYWLVTSVAVIGVFWVPAMLNVPVMDARYILASYLFWPMERVNGLVRPIANLGWTLNLEMFFYAVFAGALFWGRLRGILAAVAFLCGLTFLNAIGLFTANGALAAVSLNFWTDPIILNFVIGIGIGALYMNGARTTKVVNLVLLAGGVVVALIVEYNATALLALPESNMFYRLATSLPMLPVMLIGALGTQVDLQKTWVKAGVFLGNASYSLYLVHPFALRPFRAIWIKLAGVEMPIWSFGVTSFVLALAVGVACYLLAERPMSNFFTKRRAIDYA